MRVFLLSTVLLLGACSQEEENIYDRFNGSNDVIEVQVGAEEIGSLAVIDLNSSTGAVVIGSASIDPDAGPSGTVHLLEVAILEEYIHQVDKVSVEIDAADRGIQSYDLQADSADESLYRLEIESVADEGETRTDILEVQVWDISGDTDGDSPS
jgi:hypothetical protein